MTKRLILGLLLCFSGSLYGQSSDRIHAKREEINAQKVAYITAKMNLTPKEAQQFWPLYNAYREELATQRHEKRRIETKLRNSTHELSDIELDQLMLNRFALERGEIALEEKYYDKYKQVLSLPKIAEFYNAEHTFKRVLLNRLKAANESGSNQSR